MTLARATIRLSPHEPKWEMPNRAQLPSEPGERTTKMKGAVFCIASLCCFVPQPYWLVRAYTHSHTAEELLGQLRISTAYRSLFLSGAVTHFLLPGISVRGEKRQGQACLSDSRSLQLACQLGALEAVWGFQLFWLEQVGDWGPISGLAASSGDSSCRLSPLRVTAAAAAAVGSNPPCSSHALGFCGWLCTPNLLFCHDI